MAIRFRARAPLAVLFAAALAAGAVAAEDVAPASPPTIEIVDDGGVAESWRADGGDFATYGPEGEAVTPTPEAQALQALNAAYDVQFVALQAATPQVVIRGDPTQPSLSCGPTTECIDGNPVIGRVPVESAAQHALAREILGGWLQETGGPWSACQPAYHHALTYSSAGHAWEVLLCYGCGHYAIRRDGVEVAAAESASTTGIEGFNALLAEAGLRHWDPATREWKTPATE